jgi:hypothetical protein
MRYYMWGQKYACYNLTLSYALKENSYHRSYVHRDELVTNKRYTYSQVYFWWETGLPYHVYANEEKKEGKKREKRGGGKNSEFSRHFIIFYATEH